MYHIRRCIFFKIVLKHNTSRTHKNKIILAANQMRHLAKLARLQHMNYLDSHAYINNKYITDIP